MQVHPNVAGAPARCSRSRSQERDTAAGYLRLVKRLWSDPPWGATAMEYAVLIGVIAVVIITAVSVLGDSVQGTLDGVSEQVGNASGG